MDTDENRVHEKCEGAINQDNDSTHSQNVNDHQISQTEEKEKEIETEGEGKEEGEMEIYDKKRYYSVLLLPDDPNDDEREENKNEPKSKLKNLFRILKHGKNLRRSRKRSPQPADITYIAVDYTNKAIQCSRSDIKASC